MIRFQNKVLMVIFQNLIISVILLFSSTPVWGSEIFGSLQASYEYYFQEINDRDSSRPRFLLSLENKDKFGKYFNYKLSPYFAYDGLSEVDQQKTLFDVEEAYVEFVKNIFSFRLGWLQHNWGVTEGFDPTAVLQSYRLWNPLELKAIASPSLLATWSWSSSQFEFLAVFDRRASQLPQAKSRWLPDEFFDSKVTVGDDIAVLPQDPQYSYLGYQELDKARQWNFGLRYYKTLGSLDTSIFFFEGASPVPMTQTGFNVTSIGTIDGKDAFFMGPNITLTAIDYRLQTTGATLVYSWGRSIFRYAGHYQKEVGENIAIYDWQVAHVVAWELSPLATGDLIALFEYSKVKRASDFNSTVTSLGRLFDDAYVLGLRYELTEKWSVYGSILYDTIYSDQVHNLSLTGKLMEKLSARLAWVNLQENNKSTALAGYTKNDQLSLQLEWFF